MDQTTPRASASFLWVYPIAFVFALATLGAGIYLAVNDGRYEIVAAGAACVVLVLVTWPLAGTFRRSSIETNRILDSTLKPMQERLDEFGIVLNLISEQQLISDRAKSLAFREKDRDALRRAISEEIAKKDWDAAAVLAREMEHTFGYRAEVLEFTQKINSGRNLDARVQLAGALSAVDEHCRAERWQQALREVDTLIQLHPSEPSLQRLPQQIVERMNAHKAQLLASYRQAVARKDVDGSIAILKKVDPYLTPTEAEEMAESARQVFKDKLAQLKHQMHTAVQQHRWTDALQLAESIMRDFPNSQMAKEVRDNIDSLRARATEQRDTANV
jgi:regulator of sirC expression with transglutaminase-like and TPR domain